MHTSICKGHRQGTGAIEVRQATGMIKVQVREHDVGDVGEGHALRLQRRFKNVIDLELALLLVAPLRAHAAVHKDRAGAVSQQQTVGGHRDAVGGVGGDLLFPQGLWNDPEHRAAIKGERTGADDDGIVAAEL